MSLKIKLIGLMVLILGATVLVSYTIFDRSEAELLQQVVQHVKSVESVGNVLEIQQILTRNTHQTVQRNLLVRMSQGGRATQVSLLDLSHTVVDSSNDEDVGLSLAELEERRVKNTGGTFWDRLLRKHINTYDVTFPVYENGLKRGYVNIILVMNDLEYLIKKAKYSNILWISGIFIAGTAIAVFTVNRFTRPIDQLVAASKSVAEGHFQTRVNGSGSGELQTLIAGFNEMTEKLQEHKALEQRVQRSERMAALGELGARLAHEIRNPLNSITLIIDHLRDRFSPQEEKQQRKFENYVTNIKTELQRLNKLVSDFLQVSRPLHPEMKAIPVKPLLQQIVQLLENEARQHQVEFQLDVSTEELEIRADEGLLKTACLNISLNAIQAVENGGRLVIQAQTSLEEDTPLCQISFSDTGPGIPQEHRENIFQPYFTTKKDGTGLGLSIVNRVIEDHHGTITVSSEEGRGTTITLLLPMEGVME
ncbi:MAG: HAMP domain-containing protein [bacterium]|nr:HAMP domain-containing protein [bacterium]